MGTRLSRMLALLKAIDTDTDLTALDTLIDGAIVKIDTIDSNVDSILTDTGTTLDTKIDAIQDSLDEIRVFIVEMHNDINPTNPIT